MKKNLWIAMMAVVSGSLLAQPVTNPAPAPAIASPAPASTNAVVPAPAITPTNSISLATNAPAAKAKKKTVKKSADKKSPVAKKSYAAPMKTVPLVAGQATVIASNVNVRGQAKLNSEVITKVTKGQNVTVLEEVHLKNSGPEEPSAWAKIILPETARVWVNAPFIDATNKTVIPKRLKLRGGPSENYSVLGFLKQGDPVKEVSTKGEWIEIEAPAEASAFIAAQYLKQEPLGTSPTEVAATTSTVTEPPPVAPATDPTLPPPSEPAATTNAPVVTETSTNEPAPVVQEPPPPRIVQREGIVRGTFSIQAPTKYELVSMDTHRPINYLFAESKDLDLSRYKGLHIIVTGEEGLDERWRNAPVLTIQKIQVLE